MPTLTAPRCHGRREARSRPKLPSTRNVSPLPMSIHATCHLNPKFYFLLNCRCYSSGNLPVTRLPSMVLPSTIVPFALV